MKNIKSFDEFVNEGVFINKLSSKVYPFLIELLSKPISAILPYDLDESKEFIKNFLNTAYIIKNKLTELQKANYFSDGYTEEEIQKIQEMIEEIKDEYQDELNDETIDVDLIKENLIQGVKNRVRFSSTDKKELIQYINEFEDPNILIEKEIEKIALRTKEIIEPQFINNNFFFN